MKTKAQTSVNAEKSIAVNNHIFSNVLTVLFGFLLISFGMWAEKIFVVFGVLLALIFVVILLISPTRYIFSSEEVVICHPFKRKEIIKWEDVRSVKKYGSWFYLNRKGFTHYKIYYRHQKEQLFLKGEICRSKKTKRLLEKYYKGKVD